MIEFAKLVQPYSNPGTYQHRDFSQRAYGQYRAGKMVFTQQYETDLKSLEQWLSDLEVALAKVPTQFDRAPK